MQIKDSRKIFVIWRALHFSTKLERYFRTNINDNGTIKTSKKYYRRQDLT